MPAHHSTAERPGPRCPPGPVGRDGRRLADEAAHASSDELAVIATPSPGVGRRGEPRWREDQRKLAGEILRHGATPADVCHVQEAVLVPLELWFVARSGRELITERAVVEAASDALATIAPASATRASIDTGGHPHAG